MAWRLLNYLNCKPVGLKEFNHVIHESGKLIFPNDFPLTESY